MDEPLTFGSLFAGIGGIDLGLERAGMRCAWQVEIDDYATRVLEKHWPDIPKFRDVRSVGADTLPAVDLIAGGFPCQDISSAGKRAGITGERSGLWAEFARIIRELRPRYVLVENVSMLLHRGIDTVLGNLAALGFDAEWHCIPAAAVGAPHRRDRVFIVAYAECDGRKQSPEVFRPWESITSASRKDVPYASIEGVGRLSIQPGRSQQKDPDTVRRGETLSDTDRKRDGGAVYEVRTGRRLLIGCRPSGYTWCIEPDVGRVAHGVPARVDRLRGLGNAVVPQVAEFVGRQIIAFDQAL